MRRSGYALPEAIMGVILVTLLFAAGLGLCRLICTVLNMTALSIFGSL